MKLYTEEQVQVAMRLSLLAETTFDEVLKLLKPIELPSDEEIDNQAEQMYPISKEYKEKYNNNYNDFNTCWQEGADWMKEQILIKNK